MSSIKKNVQRVKNIPHLVVRHLPYKQGVGGSIPSPPISPVCGGFRPAWGGYPLEVGYRAGTPSEDSKSGAEVVGAPGWVYAHPFSVPRDARRGQRVRARRSDA